MASDLNRDGGPAFPLAPEKWVDMDGVRHESQACGMTLRDYFAAKALAGLCANPGGPFQACSMSGWRIVNCDAGDIAQTAYELADAMLKASRPSSTGSADGDARDHHGGGSLDKPAPSYPVDSEGRPMWVRVTGPEGAFYVTIGKVYRVVGWRDWKAPVIKSDAGYEWTLAGPTEDDGIGQSYPTWEPCAAPLDQPAPVAPAMQVIDREGLAKAMRCVRYPDHGAWEDCHQDYRDAWLRAADAAIAYFAKLGGAK